MVKVEFVVGSIGVVFVSSKVGFVWFISRVSDGTVTNRKATWSAGNNIAEAVNIESREIYLSMTNELSDHGAVNDVR